VVPVPQAFAVDIQRPMEAEGLQQVLGVGDHFAAEGHSRRHQVGHTARETGRVRWCGV
jgi:hypothetical protein